MSKIGQLSDSRRKAMTHCAPSAALRRSVAFGDLVPGRVLIVAPYEFHAIRCRCFWCEVLKFNIQRMRWSQVIHSSNDRRPVNGYNVIRLRG